MAGAHTNPTIQALDEQFSAELADLGNDIWLNEALFQRVKQVWQQRDAWPSDSESVGCWRSPGSVLPLPVRPWPLRKKRSCGF
jgi:Zn-dependent oligopeptidase